MQSKQVYFLFASLIFFLASCKKIDVQFGQEFSDNDYTQVIKTDTFRADLSTVFVDSFVTSATGVSLLGDYTDTALGKIATKCFFELAPPAYQDIYDKTIFDSISLIVKLDKSYYGDTTFPLHIDVSKLAEKIVFPENEYSFYNTKTFSVASTIGTKDVIVRPRQSDTISIRLADTLGRTLLKKLQNKGDKDVQLSANFIEYFNGIRLSGSSSNKMIIGCTDNVIMRLSYKKPGIYNLENKYVDFTMPNSQHHFNNITVDRRNLTSPLKNIGRNNKVINSSVTGNKAYSCYAAGAMTKITFPTIADVLKLPKYVKVLSAKLVVSPVKGSFDKDLYLPPQLRLASTDLNNNIGYDLATYGGNGNLITQYGNLYIDYVYGINTSYTYDLSNYIKQLVNEPIGNNKGLLLVPPAPALQTHFPRAIVGNSRYPINKTTLEIYYVTVQ